MRALELQLTPGCVHKTLFREAAKGTDGNGIDPGPATAVPAVSPIGKVETTTPKKSPG